MSLNRFDLGLHVRETIIIIVFYFTFQLSFLILKSDSVSHFLQPLMFQTVPGVKLNWASNVEA